MRSLVGSEGTARRRDFWLHAGFFLAVNLVYLTLVGPAWFWVAAIWVVGLAVHALIVFGAIPGRGSAVGPIGSDGEG